MGPGGYEIASLAAGGAIAMTDAALDGTITNGYALLRCVGADADAPGAARPACCVDSVRAVCVPCACLLHFLTARARCAGHTQHTRPGAPCSSQHRHTLPHPFPCAHTHNNTTGRPGTTLSQTGAWGSASSTTSPSQPRTRWPTGAWSASPSSTTMCTTGMARRWGAAARPCAAQLLLRRVQGVRNGARDTLRCLTKST
jgi:hypothetical protein